jgi:hypothetical protein
MISTSLQTLLLFVTAYARFAHARSKLLDDPREVSRQRMYWINLLTPPDVVKRLQHAAGIALSRESSCVPTGGGLLLTYSNEYHAPFMELTRRGLHRSSPDCNVLLRAVAVCFGHSNSSICVQAPAAAASDHRKRQYHEIIWIKWNIIDFVFQVPGCEFVFFFDADVVLFQNPFLAIEAGLHAPLSQLDFGIMYQPTGPTRALGKALLCATQRCQSLHRHLKLLAALRCFIIVASMTRPPKDTVVPFVET